MDKVLKEQKRLVNIFKEEFADQINLIRDYQTYEAEFYQKHKTAIDALQQKIDQNIKKSEELIGDFDIVQFVNQDNQLMLSIQRGGRPIIFSIDTISDHKRDLDAGNSSISILKKFTNDANAQIAEFEAKRKEILDQMHAIKKGEPKKVLGFFVTASEQKRVDQIYESKIGKFRDPLRSIETHIKSLQFNILNYERLIEKLEEINNFNISLTPQERKSILEMYQKVNALYLENEKHIAQLMSIQNKKLNLYDFIHRKTHKNPKYEIVFMLKSLMTMRRTVPEDPEKGKITLNNITKYIDFGECHAQVEELLKSVRNNEFGEINKRTIRKIEDEIEQLKMKKTNPQKKSSSKIVQNPFTSE